MTEYERAIASGLTEQEAACLDMTGILANAFMQLPVLHHMDQAEVAQAIHVIQNKLLSRPTYRRIYSRRGS